jgi:hypothetical protein
MTASETNDQLKRILNKLRLNAQMAIQLDRMFAEAGYSQKLRQMVEGHKRYTVTTFASDPFTTS